ncbi:carboxypeptidase regulatory-like domain-containing protein [Candidatus Marinimicrobia bacterium]|jgi:plastocyanin|nr:carboxypeptidase regulatory-like domain-containing protein [Candidatus Neomarinimicrobiota bacterium]
MRKIINIGMITLLSISAITAGEIKGNVKYIGKVRKAKLIRMDADPVCAASHQEAAKNEKMVVDADGNMANVIVYLKGVKYSGKAPSNEVIIDQKGCVYSPHVFGVQAGQPVKILNSDATMHNIHGLPKVNKEFNFGMPKSLKEKSVTFSKAEDVFVIKCDVHPWMKSYTQVFDHPYFAVSGSDGSFSISNVPDGTYEAIAWQEKFGTKRLMSKKVTVKGGNAELNFSFEPPKKK